MLANHSKCSSKTKYQKESDMNLVAKFLVGFIVLSFLSCASNLHTSGLKDPELIVKKKDILIIPSALLYQLSAEDRLREKQFINFVKGNLSLYDAKTRIAIESDIDTTNSNFKLKSINTPDFILILQLKETNGKTWIPATQSAGIGWGKNFGNGTYSSVEGHSKIYWHQYTKLQLWTKESNFTELGAQFEVSNISASPELNNNLSTLAYELVSQLSN
jgi:hypothetical protein